MVDRDKVEGLIRHLRHYSGYLTGIFPERPDGHWQCPLLPPGIDVLAHLRGFIDCRALMV